MNVLLICPKPEISTRTDSAPLGILSIATYLKEKGHTVKFIDREVYKYDVEKIINDFQPGIVGISMMSTKAIHDALNISRIVKVHNIPVVWGGTLTSLMPHLVLKSGSVDYVVIGEGEITMLDLINAIANKKPLRDVDGLAFIENGEIVTNRVRDFADLSEFPVIDWSMVDPTKYFRAYFSCKKMIYLYGSKGCPGQCTFCMNKEYHRCTYRKRPLEYVTKEIAYLVEFCGLDGVYFADECCCKTKPEMHEFCDYLKNTGLNFVWGCQTRINGFSEDDFRYMFDSGCRWIYFGIESGSKERLIKVKKGIAYDKIVETITNCYRSGIVAISGFIIGFPDETEEELHQTVDLAQKLSFAMRAFHHFTAVPGSELYYSLIAEERYSLPPTLNDMAKLSPLDEVTKNLSSIPIRELNVIRTYFMMSTLLRKKTTKSAKPFGFALKIVKEQLQDMAKGGVIAFFKSFASTAKTFLTYLYYFLCFPKIRKKYGLYSSDKDNVM
ncbi:MAG: radical SAM protein [Eubacteriales bacterium]